MHYKPRNYTIPIFAFSLLIFSSLSCQLAGSLTPVPYTPVVQVISITQIVPVTQIVTPTQTPFVLKVSLEPEILLPRLEVSFLGQDGGKAIGSGCPGTDGKGEIVDYHFIVSGVDEKKEVQKVLIAGDNSTLTWASPCNNNWALDLTNLGNGNWEIYIAPSLPSKIYTILFFYTDATIALGMVNAQ